MINFFSAIIFLIIFFIFNNILLRKSFADPIMLHTLAWLIIFIIGYYVHNDFYSLENFFWTSWIFWFTAFAIGYYCFNFNIVKRKNIRVNSYYHLPNYSTLIYLLALVFLILTIVQGVTGEYGSFIMNLRLSFIFKTNSLLKPFLFLFTLLWPLLLYEGVVYKNKSNLKALIFYMAIYTLASGGKFGVLMIFSALLLVNNHRKPIGKIKLIMYCFITIVAIFLIGFLRENESDALLAYTYAPLVAYETIKNQHSLHFGHETFRFFYSALNSLGIIDISPPDDFYEYVMTPIYVNVYTAFRPFYLDFGILGIVFGGLAYGAFFGYAYRGYLKGKLIQSGLYMGYAFTIVSIPFSDLLFLNLSLVFRTIIVFAIIYIFINTRNKSLITSKRN